MLKFATQELRIGRESLWIACLASEEVLPDDDVILRDGIELAVPKGVTRAIAKAILLAREYEARGYGVDCAVLALLAAGGSYTPTDEHRYRHGDAERIISGRELSAQDVEGVTPEMRIVQFGACRRSNLRGFHFAVQVPGEPDTYVQQLGFHYPVAVANSQEITAVYGAKAGTAVAVSDLTEVIDGETVLSYARHR